MSRPRCYRGRWLHLNNYSGGVYRKEDRAHKQDRHPKYGPKYPKGFAFAWGLWRLVIQRDRHAFILPSAHKKTREYVLHAKPYREPINSPAVAGERDVPSLEAVSKPPARRCTVNGGG